MRATLDTPYVDTAAAHLGWSIEARGREPLAVVDVALPHHAPGADARCLLELGVLGASHQVRVAFGDREEVEVVACGAGPAMPRNRSATLCERPYEFRSEVRTVTPRAVGRAARLLRSTLVDRPGALVAEFPGRTDAITALQADVQGSRLRWRTWHLYPSTHEIVRTWSEVRLR